MVRWVSKTQEETEMARRGENIHKRKDGRWEGRYIKARTQEGKIQWGYVYVQRWMTSYNAIYGSFAALPLLLIWMEAAANTAVTSTFWSKLVSVRVRLVTPSLHLTNT